MEVGITPIVCVGIYAVLIPFRLFILGHIESLGQSRLIVERGAEDYVVVFLRVKFNTQGQRHRFNESLRSMRRHPQI